MPFFGVTMRIERLEKRPPSLYDSSIDARSNESFATARSWPPMTKVVELAAVVKGRQSWRAFCEGRSQ